MSLRNAPVRYTPRRAWAIASALTSMPSTASAAAGTPAASSVMTIEYGSSPVEQGRLSTRTGASGVARDTTGSPGIASSPAGSRKK